MHLKGTVPFRRLSLLGGWAAVVIGFFACADYNVVKGAKGEA